MVLGAGFAGAVGALTSPVTGGLLAILAILACTTVLEPSALQPVESSPPA